MKEETTAPTHPTKKHIESWGKYSDEEDEEEEEEEQEEEDTVKP